MSVRLYDILALIDLESKGLLPVDARGKDKDDETLMIPDNVRSILLSHVQ